MNIVMTGASRGIGLVAARGLLARPGVRLIAGVREAPPPVGATALPLDLASLASVRAFAAAALAAVPDGGIDALVLNAGGQRPDVAQRSADGHELSFASNHLGPWLLLRLLLPHMAPGGRIVITSSGTHDPAERTGVPPPRHANARWLADPAQDPGLDASPTTAGMRAYAASKLCNLLTARQAALRPELVARGVRVLAYDPGLTPGTGLVRAQIWSVRVLLWPLLPLLVPFGRTMNRLADAGGALAALATEAPLPDGAVYAALRKARITWPAPSTLAQDDGVMQALWADSAALCGEAP